MARELAINWIEAEWPTTWDEKYGASALPLSALSKLSAEKNKPSLVYVFRTADQDKLEELELKMFGTEDIVLASRFFRCYRISDSDLPNDKIRQKYLRKSGPTLIILDAKGNEVAKNKKKASKSWVFSKLKQQFSSDFGEKITKHIKKLSDWLDDLEKAEDRKADAEKMFRAAEERLDKRETAATKKRVSKTKKAFEAVEAAFDKIVEIGRKLSNPQLKARETARK